MLRINSNDPLRTVHRLAVVCLFALSLPVTKAHAQRALAPKPLVDIADDAQSGRWLGHVADAERLPSGKIAIIDGSTPQVRLYSDRGQFIRVLGGIGDGPGEYRKPVWVGSRKDTILVYDSKGSAGFLSKYLESGAFIGRTFVSGKNVAYNPVPMRYLADGTLIVNGQDRSMPGAEGDRIPGNSGYLKRVLAAIRDSSVRAIAGYPGISLSERNAAWRIAGFVAANDSLGYIVNPEGGVSVVGLRDGKVRASFATGIARQKVTGAAIEAYRSGMIDRARSSAPAGQESNRIRMAEEQLSQTVFPEYAPIAAEVLVDAEGRLWIREPRLTGPTRWHVYDARGVGGTLDVPSNLSIKKIGTDFVIAVVAGADDVQRVQVISLVSRPK